MRRHWFIASGSATLAAGLAALRPAGAAFPKASLRDKLSTRAETSNYAQTSTYADVLRILAELDMRGAPIFRGSLGRSWGGREIPFVIASRPRVTSIAAAREICTWYYFTSARDAAQSDGCVRFRSRTARRRS